MTEIPGDRWLKETFFHPRRGERGKSYTFAAGVLDDIWSFDPAPFGLSQREAEQMDPQQRLLLEVVAEAIADAGWRGSDVAGAPIGVFVGASSLDAVNRRFFDITSADPYFMTGNTLSLVANRVSYVFDLRGPSFTIDTACSSAMVAFHDAVAALESGRIDTAIVGGVNLLLSPFPFVGFSAASMLSPEGLCRPFDANGQGYVRAEGSVALILQRHDAATPVARRRYCSVVATGTNSDGRTVGVALPSSVAQAQLLKDVYSGNGIDPDDLVFVEAHGTGTRAGDPVEAKAIGESLGKRRSRPLPIGSVKSNIGHLEPVAGLAGLLKAMLALEHDSLPATLHFTQANPDIPFDDLNLTVAHAALPLVRGSGRRLAGVNSFGFGGTNAHAVITDPPPGQPEPSRVGMSAPHSATPIILLSAHEEAALAATAERFADYLAPLDETGRRDVIAEAAHGRDAATARLVAMGASSDLLIERLRAGAAAVDSKPVDGVVIGRAVAPAARTAFVFNGNGSQWAGMGRAAFTGNAVFRAAVEEIDSHFQRLARWSLVETMHADDLAEQLPRTEVAQPLLFAVQAGLVAALADLGLRPDVVLGHSVGEVAAAYAAGALTLAEAVRVIHARSTAQERARDSGLMAAVQLSQDEVAQRLAAGRWPGIEIAAINSPRAVTLAGPHADIQSFVSEAKAEGLLATVLDLAYPFHCALMEPARGALADALVGLSPRPTTCTMISTVTGAEIDGMALGSDYWWRNVREPVRFADAVTAAADAGAAVLVEIGPRSILQSYLVESVRGRKRECAVVPSLSRTDTAEIDPVQRTMAAAFVRGSAIDLERVVGARPSHTVALPAYPYQRKRLQPAWTEEALNLGLQVPQAVTDGHRHPLLGVRQQPSDWTWTAHLDADTIPALADHKVHGRVIVAGAALAELALAAGREWLGKDGVELRDVDIVSPLLIEDGHARQVRVHISPEAHRFEISSRPRLAGQEWQLHAAGRVAAIPAHHLDVAAPAPAPAGQTTCHHGQIYATAAQLGLDYGPAFRRARAVHRVADDEILVELDSPIDAWGDGTALELDPTGLDALFHGLLAVAVGEGSSEERRAFVPIRFGTLRLFARNQVVRSGRIAIRHANDRALLVDLTLLDVDGAVVATLDGARFRAFPAPGNDASSHVFTFGTERVRIAGVAEPALPERDAADQHAPARLSDASSEARLLLEAAARRIAYDAARLLAGPSGRVSASAIDEAAGGHEVARKYLWALASMAATPGEGGELTVATSSDLPEISDILATVTADHPGWIADVVLTSRAAQVAGELVRGNAEEILARPVFSSATLDHLATHAPRTIEHVDAVSDRVRAVAERWPAGRALRILELGPAGGSLTRQLSTLVAGGRGRIVAVCGTTEEADRLSTRLEDLPEVDVVSAGDLTDHDWPAFDLVVSANGLFRMTQADKLLAGAVTRMVDGGALILSSEQPDGFHTAVLGLLPDYFARSIRPQAPIGAILDAQDLRAAVERAGLVGVSVAVADQEGTGPLLLIARKPKAAPAEATDDANVVRLPTGDPIIVGLTGRSGGRRLLADIERRLIKLGRAARLATPGEEPLGAADARDGEERVQLIGVGGEGTAPDDEISGSILDIRRLVAERQPAPSRVWLLLPGAVRAMIGDGPGDPGMAAIWAFARTLQNEMPAVDIRLLDWSASLGRDDVAARIADVVAHPSLETELLLGRDATVALRVQRGKLQSDRGHVEAEQVAARLVPRGAGNGLDRLQWLSVPREAAGPGEVQIAVAATGLNFRDVMWTLGLLPDEALEDGFAGPTLGFECSGYVIGVGEGVTSVQVGDPVIALAPSAFSSHVTVAEKAVTKLPESVDPVAAATIPVAFLTSYYALHHLAHLGENEWVLIHGGAGGVGLAAMQVARWCGARVIATAGSPEKRAFLERLGIEHVLDSRSLDFIDDVRRITGGDGVHVVLNSLAGEAMERSIELVRPFGRFLELGKRDYYANTLIGLRPFRRNVSYFGIDADQLLRLEPALADKLLNEMMALFADGTFTPLPYRLFRPDEAIEAFRLMQQSGHIGKILVAAPEPALGKHVSDATFKADPAGAHVVIGGVGGFGFATAEWLATTGARHLVLVSRGGALAPESAPRVAMMEGRGVRVDVRACDITDDAALASLLADIRRVRPIKGIVHAAMALDDALIANLTPARIATALRPKAIGGRNLDRLTRDDRLDYFVLYSSITTLIGNPGQAAYVAGNAYIEELARERRRAGLPAVAVGWGAISDAGYLARQSDAAKAIAMRTGGAGLTASAALTALGRILAGGPRLPEDAVVHVAPMSWATATRTLKTLGGPTYALLQRLAREEGSGQVASDDIGAAIEGLDDEAALGVIVSALSREVARILRLPLESINPRRPLMDFGMDSLMSAELLFAARDRMRLEIPAMSIADAVTINDIAGKALARLRSGAPQTSGIEVDLVRQHLSENIDANAAAQLVRSLADQDVGIAGGRT